MEICSEEEIKDEGLDRLDVMTRMDRIFFLKVLE